MKIRTTVVAAALTLASPALFAASGDVLGGGQINFTGTVETDSCFVESSVSGVKNIDVAMGIAHVSTISKSSFDNPILAPGNAQGDATFDITCSAAGAVEIRLNADASKASPDALLLKLNNGAQGDKLASGFGIAIFKDRNKLGKTNALKVTDGVLFSKTFAETDKDKPIQISFAAGYVKSTDLGATVTGGTANDTLPFTIITP